MQISRLSDISRRWRTVLVLIMVGVASFTIGAFANQIPIANVASLGGNTSAIPPPNLKVLAAVFVTDRSTGNITAVNVNATTTGTTSTLMFYQVTVQIQCAISGPVEAAPFQCDVGIANAILPGNMTSPLSATLKPVTTIINIPLNHPLKPSVTDIRFIGVAVQAVIPVRQCTPTFSFGSDQGSWSFEPNFNPPTPPYLLSYGNNISLSAIATIPVGFNLRLTSQCGFTDTISFTDSVAPSFTATMIVNLPPSIVLPPGGTAFTTETVTLNLIGPGITNLTGKATVTINACGTTSSICQSVSQTFFVGATPF